MFSLSFLVFFCPFPPFSIYIYFSISYSYSIPYLFSFLPFFFCYLS
jgi:hypothetical protein